MEVRWVRRVRRAVSQAVEKRVMRSGDPKGARVFVGADFSASNVN